MKGPVGIGGVRCLERMNLRIQKISEGQLDLRSAKLSEAVGPVPRSEGFQHEL